MSVRAKAHPLFLLNKRFANHKLLNYVILHFNSLSVSSHASISRFVASLNDIKCRTSLLSLSTSNSFVRRWLYPGLSPLAMSSNSENPLTDHVTDIVPIIYIISPIHIQHLYNYDDRLGTSCRYQHIACLYSNYPLSAPQVVSYTSKILLSHVYESCFFHDRFQICPSILDKHSK